MHGYRNNADQYQLHVGRLYRWLRAGPCLHPTGGTRFEKGLIILVGCIGLPPLYREPLVIVAPASVKDQTAHAVLAAHLFLRFDRTQRTGRQIDRVLPCLGMQARKFLELNAIATLVKFMQQ